MYIETKSISHRGGGVSMVLLLNSTSAAGAALLSGNRASLIGYCGSG